MDPAPLISKGDSNCSYLAQAEVPTIVVIVWCDPANPHWRRVLSREHSHWVVVLPEKTKHNGLHMIRQLSNHFQRNIFEKCGLIYSRDPSIVNTPIFFWRMAAETNTYIKFRLNAQPVTPTTSVTVSENSTVVALEYHWIAVFQCRTWISMFRPVVCRQSRNPRACSFYSRSCHCCCSVCQMFCGWPWGMEGCLPFRQSVLPEKTRIKINSTRRMVN